MKNLIHEKEKLKIEKEKLIQIRQGNNVENINIYIDTLYNEIDDVVRDTREWDLTNENEAEEYYKYYNEVKNKVISYSDKRKFITSLISTEQITVLVGENGSGKTSFLQELARLNKGNFYYIPTNKLELRAKLRDAVVPKNNFTFHDIYEIETRRGFIDRKKVNISEEEAITKILQGMKYNYTRCENNPDAYFQKLLEMNKVWKLLFNNSDLEVDEFGLQLQKNDLIYDISSASDGEYVLIIYMLYILFSPKNSIIAIDEVDNHLNVRQLKTLFLWGKEYRQDLKFMFITHNYSFINIFETKTLLWFESQKEPRIITEKELVAESIYERINGEDMPILLCEGLGTDELFYKNLFPEFKVIGVGSCELIEKIVDSNDFHKKIIVAIRDKDTLSNDEIKSREAKGIYVLPYRHIENLIISKPAFDLLSKYNPLLESQKIQKKYLNLMSNIEITEKMIIDDYKKKAIEHFQNEVSNCKNLNDIKSICAPSIDIINNPETFDEFLQLSKSKNLGNQVFPEYKDTYFITAQNSPEFCKEFCSLFFQSDVFKVKND